MPYVVDRFKRESLTLQAVVDHRRKSKRLLQLSDAGEITRQEHEVLWQEAVREFEVKYGLTHKQAGLFSRWEWDYKVWGKIDKLFK